MVTPPPVQAAPPLQTPDEGRPRWLGLCVVGTIVLGGLGALSGLGGVVGLAMGDPSAWMPSSAPPGGHGAEITRIQREMAQEIRAASMPWLAGLLAVLNIATSGYAVWSGAGVQQDRAGMLAHLRRSLVVLLGYELVAFLFAIVVQSRTLGVVRRYMNKLMTVSGGGGAGAQDVQRTVNAIMDAGIYIGIAVAVAWGALKLGFCLWARLYAAKDEVVSYVRSRERAA
jgi:hypothetical protein